MYIGHALLASVLCAVAVVTHGAIFNKKGQGITNITEFNIPEDTTEAWYHSNYISHVPRSFFKNLPYLEKISFWLNPISTIDDYAFMGVPNITEINLYMNHLSVITEFMFAGSWRLQVLDLWKNRIHAIEPYSFFDNPELRSLQLGHNDLQSLPELMFHPYNHPAALHELSFEGKT